MNCQRIRQQIDARVATGTPASGLDKVLSEHLEQCDLCRRYHADAVLARELAFLEAPVPDAAFVARSIRRAVEQPAPLRQTPAFRRLAAVAASVVLAVTLGLLVVNLPGDDPARLDEPRLAVSEVKREQVRIVIYSDEEHHSAEFSIELAENLELEGYGSQRSLAWTAALNKGANLLTLPLLVGEGGGEIRVMSRFGDGSHSVSIRVVNPDDKPQLAPFDEAGLPMFQGLTG